MKKIKSIYNTKHIDVRQSSNGNNADADGTNTHKVTDITETSYEYYMESMDIHELMQMYQLTTHKIIEDRAARGCFCDPLFSCTCGKTRRGK